MDVRIVIRQNAADGERRRHASATSFRSTDAVGCDPYRYRYQRDRRKPGGHIDRWGGL